MRIHKPSSLSVLPRVFEDAGRYYLSLGVAGLFDFDAGAELLMEQQLWSLVKTELAQGSLFDEGMPKPRGEVLLSARSCAPAAETRRSAEVSLSLGPVRKRLAVFGNRIWRKKAGVFEYIPEPEAFAEMPVDYARAFGGDGFADNPLGRGIPSPGREDETPLPNIENPEALIHRPDDRPAPVGFGPLDPRWPRRARKAGTYDQTWLDAYYPGFPADMDWGFFNLAPEDQQIEGWFRGDESFELRGMHPERAILQAALPAVRARLFVRQESAVDAPLLEVPLRMDTVWLFPHTLRGAVVFRALLEVNEEDAADVTHLVTAYERMSDELLPVDHYRDALERFADPEGGALPWQVDEALIPSGFRSPLLQMAEDPELVRDFHGDGILQKNLRAGADASRETAKAGALALGMAPDKIDDMLRPSLPDQKTLMNMNPAAMRKQALAEAEKHRQAADAAAKRAAETLGVDPIAFAAELRRKSPGGSDFSVDETVKLLRKRGEADPDLEEKIRTAHDNARRMRVRGAHGEPAPAAPDARTAAWWRETVSEEQVKGCSFAEVELPAVDLSGLDLRGADFRGAWLAGANFSEANLEGADFSGAVLAHANLGRANLAHANLTDANLGKTDLAGARMEGADLSGCVLEESNGEGANLAGANLTGLMLTKVRFGQCDLSRALLDGCVFQETDLTGATLTGARLSEAVFLQVSMEEADLSGAVATSAVFHNIRARNCRFRGADLTGAFVGQASDLAEADFSRANLTRANLGGVALWECVFGDAILREAHLQRADLSEACLVGADARGASFLRANLSGADGTALNLMEGSLHGADLRRAILRRANLYAVDFLKARFGETDLDEAILDGTILAEWQPA